jgi:hypothetical protein
MKAGKLTAKQRELLERIELMYADGWFQASEMRATLADLDALYDAGYLDRSKPVPQPTMRTYRLRA